ncbi:heme-copper oxidase subunit III [Pontibacter sp. 172403-2]|uniref:cytochrome c oxidase subunit 3 n=1 Tax=Pontibacter rufus TaxID=2791028 RepID=UPI0018AFF6FD|nr:heme-copper oxidase subunit III [Pontibacter sp. 172403-2]MBF9254046.1 heme-copper oxidase subunit III [Pontibacter sp. 172403-2]
MENRLMMFLVIGTEAIFFLSLIFAFVYFAFEPGYDNHTWQLLNIKSTGIFSVLLFASSFTFWRAEKSYKKGEVKRLKRWLFATIGLGTVFLFGQGREYWSLLHEDLTISKNNFGTSFYTLTGFHGLHVFIGLVILAIVLKLAAAGDFDEPDSSVINTVGIYWHFVDVVWLVVFTVVYVLPGVLL